MRKQPEYFEIPVFPIPLYAGKVMLCMTADEWASLAAVYGAEEDIDGCKGLSIQYRTPEEGRVYAVGVFDGAVDTLVHELAHATFHLLGDVGVELTDGGANEAFTYAIGWMMREIFPVFQARLLADSRKRK